MLGQSPRDAHLFRFENGSPQAGQCFVAPMSSEPPRAVPVPTRLVPALLVPALLVPALLVPDFLVPDLLGLIVARAQRPTVFLTCFQ